MKLLQKIGAAVLGITLLISTQPVIAANEVAKEEQYIYTLTEVKELALKNSRTIKNINEIYRQVESQKYIASNDYDKTKYGSWYGASNKVNYLAGTIGNKKAELQQIEDDDSFDPNNPSAEWINLKMELNSLESQVGLASASEAGAEGSTKAMKKVLEKSKDAVADTKRAKEDTIKQVELTVEQLYTAILAMEDQVELLKRNCQYYDKLIKIEETKRELGLSSEVDLNKVYTQDKDINNKYTQLQDSLKLSKMQLNDIMGRPLGYNLKLTPFIVGPVTPHGEVNELTEKALGNTATIGQQQRDIYDMKDDLDDLSDSNEEEVQKAQINQAKLNLEKTKVDITNGIKSLMADLEAKEKDYKLKHSEFAIAKQNYEHDKVRYGLGTISQIQYQASELTYQEKLNAYTKASYDYFINRQKLKLASEGIMLF